MKNTRIREEALDSQGDPATSSLPAEPDEQSAASDERPDGADEQPADLEGRPSELDELQAEFDVEAFEGEVVSAEELAKAMLRRRSWAE